MIAMGIAAERGCLYVNGYDHPNILAGAGHVATQLDTTGVSTFAKTDAGMRITTMALSVVGQVPGIDAETFAELAEQAKVGCPVSNALVGNVEITLEATLV